jgi:hypothetical protein
MVPVEDVFAHTFVLTVVTWTVSRTHLLIVKDLHAWVTLAAVYGCDPRPGQSPLALAANRNLLSFQ